VVGAARIRRPTVSSLCFLRGHETSFSLHIVIRLKTDYQINVDRGPFDGFQAGYNGESGGKLIEQTLIRNGGQLKADFFDLLRPLNEPTRKAVVTSGYNSAANNQRVVDAAVTGIKPPRHSNYRLEFEIVGVSLTLSNDLSLTADFRAVYGEEIQLLSSPALVVLLFLRSLHPDRRAVAVTHVAVKDVDISVTPKPSIVEQAEDGGRNLRHTAQKLSAPVAISASVKRQLSTCAPVSPKGTLNNVAPGSSAKKITAQGPESASTDVVVQPASAVLSTEGRLSSGDDVVVEDGDCGSAGTCPYFQKMCSFLSSNSHLHRSILCGRYVSLDRAPVIDRVLSALNGNRDSKLVDLFHSCWPNPRGIGDCLILAVMNVWVYSKFSSMHYDYDSSIIRAARISMFLHAFVGCVSGNSNTALVVPTDVLNDSAFCIAESLNLTGLGRTNFLMRGPDYVYSRQSNRWRSKNKNVMCNPTILEFYIFVRGIVVGTDVNLRPWLSTPAVVLLQELNKGSPPIAVWDTTVARATLDEGDAVFGQNWGEDQTNVQSIIRNGTHFQNLIGVATPNLTQTLAEFGLSVCMQTHSEITHFLMGIFAKSMNALLAGNRFSSAVLDMMKDDLIEMNTLTKWDPSGENMSTAMLRASGTHSEREHSGMFLFYF
jgi:hypothetical protein